MKTIVSIITDPKKALNAILAFMSLSLVLLVGLGLSVKFAIEQKDENNEILRIVKEHELGQIDADAAWFHAGCEASIDAITEEAKKSDASGNLQLSLMIYKESCKGTAEAIKDQLLAKRAQADKDRESSK